MPEKKPEPNPKPKSEIPTGKLVGKPAAPKPKPAPAPVVPAAPAARPVAPPAPAAAPAPVGTEYDVDLVAVPCPPPRKPRDERSFFDLDRRDFIMAGTGVLGSLLAVLFGLLMAKAFQRKPEEK